MAPPEIAIINNAEAVFVNLPKPSKVNGQIAGQTKAFAKPKAATNLDEMDNDKSSRQASFILQIILAAFFQFLWMKQLLRWEMNANPIENALQKSMG